MNTETHYLAQHLNSTRVITKAYMSALKGQDMFKEFEFEGKKFNCAYWLLGHIAWAENTLVLLGTGGERVRLPWLKKFAIGSSFEKTGDLPEVKELIDTLKLIHEKAVAHVAQLDPKVLDEVNNLDFTFAGENSKRMVIQHAARHEACHAGHLGWVCKMMGVKTM